MLLSRPNRGNRRIAVKDVRTAFLQSNKFPADIIKYISFKDPVTKVIEYFRQTGPVYRPKQELLSDGNRPSLLGCKL